VPSLPPLSGTLSMMIGWPSRALISLARSREAQPGAAELRRPIAEVFEQLTLPSDSADAREAGAMIRKKTHDDSPTTP
jgi:hypothetical protein